MRPHQGHLIAAFLSLALTWSMPGNAQNVTCTASMTSLDFGTVDPLDSFTTASATLNYTCTNQTNQPRSIRVCFSIGEPGGRQTSPRQMFSGGNTLDFQLYQDPGRSVVWGSQFFGPPTPLEVTRTHLDGHDSFSGSATLYGVIPGGQTSISIGNYADNYLSGDTAITVIDGTGNSLPGACGTTSSGNYFPFNVSATVQQVCTVSATTLNFGTVAGFLTGNHDGTSTVSVKCVNGTAYKVGLDNGQHGTRRMQGPGGYIDYELYRDNDRTQRWGTNLGVDTVSGSGSGNPQSIPVYGRVPAQATPAAGTYSDTVTVTVTY